MFRSYDWGEILIRPPSDFSFPFGCVNASDSKFRSDHQRRWPIHISILTHIQVASSASLAFRKSSQKGHEIYRIGHHLCFRHPLFIRLRIWNKECISPLCGWKSERSTRLSVQLWQEKRKDKKTGSDVLKQIATIAWQFCPLHVANRYRVISKAEIGCRLHPGWIQIA